MSDVPLQRRSNDQCVYPPALPAPGHPAEDRLARGSVPDEGAAQAQVPGSPKEDGSLCRRTWCFRLIVMVEEEKEEEV